MIDTKENPENLLAHLIWCAEGVGTPVGQDKNDPLVQAFGRGVKAGIDDTIMWLKRYWNLAE